MAGSGFVPARAALLGAAFSFLLAGCAGPDAFGGSRQAVVAWSQTRGFTATNIDAPPFRLLAMLRQGAPSETITVYVEGDGAPWATPWHPPRDPTPIKPIALALASADPAPMVAYLGRPCQYPEAPEPTGCDSSYWMERRFAPEVLRAFGHALDRLKLDTGARQFRLVGYSGGGVIVALLAAERDDVRQFVTIAAPLDLTEWVRIQDVSPLVGSLNPARLPVAQWQPRGVHFVAERDQVVPMGVVEGFVRAKGGRIEVVPGFDHECCWTRDWSMLLRRLGLLESER
jgi:pimeloyl-ACP methyl ester carboxylesterase